MVSKVSAFELVAKEHVSLVLLFVDKCFGLYESSRSDDPVQWLFGGLEAIDSIEHFAMNA